MNNKIIDIGAALDITAAPHVLIAGTTGSGKAPEGTDAPEAAKTGQASTAKKASTRAKKTNK